MRILTFDIEDWFHILDEETTKSEKEWSQYESRMQVNMDRIFGLLEKHQQKATFFCLGWIAEKHPEIIKQIDSYGFEIASHSYSHQLIYEQSKESFTTDLERSVKTIEDLIGKKVTSYRAPGFSLKEGDEWVFDVLLEQGIDTDCSIFPAGRGHGGYPSFGSAEPAILEVGGKEIKEFPMNVTELLGKKIVFSGGGYFRFFPYSYIKRLTKKSDYVMTYFHPRDFDPDQPVITNLSLARKFKSYYGLGGALRKLERLITDAEFTDLKGAQQQVDWGSVKRIPIKKA